MGDSEPNLELEAMIGFNGAVPHGLQVHPDCQHLVYPVGCTVVIEDIETKKQQFLSGHKDSVTCIAISKSGRFLSSGQQTHMGFKADAIIWDYENREIYAMLTLHMVKVEAMAFSPNDMYLATLGGADDGSVVIWNIETKQAICGSPAQVMSAGRTLALTFSKNSDFTFVTGGESTMRVWHLDVENRKIRPTDVNMGKIKRVINCIEFDDRDEYFYCGTTTGDIVAIRLNTKIFQKVGPAKGRFNMGITDLKLLGTGDLVVGSGDGQICICSGLANEFKRKSSIAATPTLEGAVTSIALRGKGHQIFVGTNLSNIYRVALFSENSTLTPELVSTCHYAPVNDIVFPKDCSELYCTCSFQDVRLWDLHKNKELLRITVPNMTCTAVEIMSDGMSIITAWDDGLIRAFYPESGKPMYTITNAHPGGVSALATCMDNTFEAKYRIISGGKEGKVRIWSIGVSGNSWSTRLVATLSEHKAEVTAIKVRQAADQCVTSCFDGSCIIWDLVKMCRSQMIRVNTLFKYVCYHPDEHQIITAGTDRKIGYYEALDASTVRALDGSSGSINTLDISSYRDCGYCFISAGDDKLVKVWKYDEGVATHIGIGHSASITRAKISPNSRHILSVSTDGAILRWKFPH